MPTDSSLVLLCLSKGPSQIGLYGVHQVSPLVSSKEITKKGSKVEQPFLHMTHFLDLMYTTSNCYQNISKDMKAMESTKLLSMDG